jgi:hypothetical protein
VSDDPAARYAAAVAAYGRHKRDGDVAKANRAHGEVVASYKALRDAGGLAAVLGLLDDDNPAVRLTAATHALASSLEPDRAEAVLDALVDERQGIGFTAEMTLDLWRRGKLRPPDEPSG